MHSDDDEIELIPSRGSIYGQRTIWPQIMGKLRALTLSGRLHRRNAALEISPRLPEFVFFIPLSMNSH